MYMLGGTCVSTFCSMGTPYVKQAELGHSHFLGRLHGQSSVLRALVTVQFSVALLLERK